MLNLIKAELQKVIVGHENLIDSMLIALITNSHLLIEGVPGIAKTTAVNTLAKVLGVEFKRIQFTPDLLPSDITGVEVYNPKTNEFQIKKGPIFANLVLADEINRAPAKVQSALLEVMQERQVTIAEETFKVDNPFLVIATQNPIDEEGTYNLPFASLDRFLMKIVLKYNTFEEELKIIQMLENNPQVNQVATKEDIFKLQKDLKTIHIDNELIEYITKLVYATREPFKFGIDGINEYIECGAGPRATISLFNAARAKAMLNNRDYVTPRDIAEIFEDVIRHRIILNYKAEADEITPEFVAKKILEGIEIP